MYGTLPVRLKKLFAKSFDAGNAAGYNVVGKAGCLMKRKIYVVISQPTTCLAKCLCFLSRQKYNHVSLALTPTLDEMYSFGRRTLRNPFNGGFIQESINGGIFKQLPKTQAIVLALDVSETAYHDIQDLINSMLQEKHKFNYNYWGLFLAWFRKNYETEYRMYCSQFVRKCLTPHNIGDVKALPKSIRPMDFLKLKNKRIIYTGLLKDFAVRNA